eukprot:2306101-Rhodomonas_salina.1
MGCTLLSYPTLPGRRRTDAYAATSTTLQYKCTATESGSMLLPSCSVERRVVAGSRGGLAAERTRIGKEGEGEGRRGRASASGYRDDHFCRPRRRDH